jgi:DNA-binding CsgD family transcriptional regulator
VQPRIFPPHNSQEAAHVPSNLERRRVGGRKPKLTDAQKKTVRKLYDSRELTVKEIAAMHSVSSPTVYAALRGQPLRNI